MLVQVQPPRLGSLDFFNKVDFKFYKYGNRQDNRRQIISGQSIKVMHDTFNIGNTDRYRVAGQKILM